MQHIQINNELYFVTTDYHAIVNNSNTTNVISDQ